jgi:hypothetical protein
MWLHGHGFTEIDRREVIRQHLSPVSILVPDPLSNEIRQRISKMVLSLQGKGPLHQGVCAGRSRPHGHGNRLRLVCLLPIGINVDSRKYRAQSGQSREIEFRVGDDVGCHGSSGCQPFLNEVVELPSEEVERDTEFPIRIQEDDVVKVFVAVEVNTAVALNKMDCCAFALK